MNFQDVILNLEQFWGSRGCVIHQPYDIEVGAGTFNPATFFRVLGPEPEAGRQRANSTPIAEIYTRGEKVQLDESIPRPDDGEVGEVATDDRAVDRPVEGPDASRSARGGPPVLQASPLYSGDHECNLGLEVVRSLVVICPTRCSREKVPSQVHRRSGREVGYAGLGDR